MLNDTAQSLNLYWQNTCRSPRRRIAPLHWHASINEMIAALGVCPRPSVALADAASATLRRTFKAGAELLRRDVCALAAVDSDVSTPRNERRRAVECMSPAQAFERTSDALAIFIWHVGRLKACLTRDIAASEGGRKGLTLRVYEQEHGAAAAICAAAGFYIASKTMADDDVLSEVWVLGWDSWPGAVEPLLRLDGRD